MICLHKLNLHWALEINFVQKKIINMLVALAQIIGEVRDKRLPLHLFAANSNYDYESAVDPGVEETTTMKSRGQQLNEFLQVLLPYIMILLLMGMFCMGGLLIIHFQMKKSREEEDEAEQQAKLAKRLVRKITKSHDQKEVDKLKDKLYDLIASL